MKLVYLTAKTYPSTTADHIFVREMAKAFAKELGDDFSLVVANDYSCELAGINVHNLRLKIKKGLTLFFYCWMPFYILKHGLNSVEAVFFSVDQNLLRVLFFYRRLFNFKYKVVADWHMLFSDREDAKCLRESDGNICTTKHLKDLLIEQFSVPSDKVKVAYGGVDLELFSDDNRTSLGDSLSGSLGDSLRGSSDVQLNHFTDLRTKPGLSETDFLVGYVGFYKTMGMSKGLDTMLKALSLIDDKNIKMVFVGGKKEEIAEYESLAQSLNVHNRVVFVPVVGSDLVPEYEKAMDILVIPYPDKPHYRDYGFPMKVYEYMASRKPIIYSNLPIIREVLGDCATSFEPDNENDLAAKIIDCRADSVKVEGLVGKAYDKVKGCTWEKRAANIIAFLKGI